MAVSRKPSCPSGHVLRESYHSKSGKLVKARCIRKTGLMPGKASEKAQIRRSKSDARATMAVRMSLKAGIKVPKRCPKGMTLRAGYTRKSYTRKPGSHIHSGLVVPACITRRGKSDSRKSRVISLDPEDHYLSEFGYHDLEHKPREARHDALHKLIAHFEPIKGKMATWNYVIRALNARYILNRNTNPKVARIMKTDQRAISKLYKKEKKTASSM